MLDLPPAQIECLAQAIYGEARGESTIGQRAVAHVILNRAKKRGLTPCQVVREKGQFHFKIRNNYSGQDWNNSYRVATNPGLDPTRGAMFFHSVRVNPRWRFKYVTTIGNHKFYK